MASGLAVVAAKAGGAAGILTEGETGLFAKPLNGKDLADKLAWLIKHPTERKQLVARSVRAAQEFGWERILDRLFRSYHEVVEQHRQRNVAA
jgi:glycosyltransferase involved in cell wall biosynthesis